jgi:hypothetical protein
MDSLPPVTMMSAVSGWTIRSVRICDMQRKGIQKKKEPERK